MSRIRQVTQFRKAISEPPPDLPASQKRHKILRDGFIVNETLVPITGRREPGETDQAVLACNDWLQMGVERNMAELQRYYDRAVKEGIAVPSTKLFTLYRWSSEFDWPTRAKAYDTRLADMQNEDSHAIANTGLATKADRIIKLKILAQLLSDQIESGHLWMYEVKVIGSGRNAKEIRVRKFNTPLIDQYRSTLDDLAKETGGRVRRAELGGPDGGPLQVGVYELDEIRNKISKRLEQFNDGTAPSDEPEATG